MPSVRRLVGDLGSGKHLDLYATAAISVALGVLGVFDIVNVAVLAAATLATLGFVVIGSLGDRMQIATLTASTDELARLTRRHLASLNERPSADRLLTASTSGLDIDIRDARDVRICGVTLSRSIRNHMPALQHGLAHGATVRIAVIEPSDETLREAARRGATPDAPIIFENRLRSTIDLLDQLAADPGNTGSLQIRFVPYVPAFGITAVDPDDSDGRIYVDIYSHRSASREPLLPLRADRDPRWYRHFVREFDQVWASGRPAELPPRGAARNRPPVGSAPA